MSDVPSTVFDLQNPGNYVNEYINENVGKVSGHDYKYYEKGMDGRITYMTCDEYIDKCINDVFHSSYESTVTNAVDDAKVHEYAKRMLMGDTFPVPYLNYVDEQQEGRHRAFAVKEAFGADAEFPVLEVYKAEPTLPMIQEYCRTKTNNAGMGDMLMPEIAGRWYSQKTIYDYLGWPYNGDDDDEDTEAIEDEEDESTAQDKDYDIDNLDDDILLEDVAEFAGIDVDELEDMSDVEFSKLVDKLLDSK